MRPLIVTVLAASCTGTPTADPPKPDTEAPAAPADADAFGSYTLSFGDMNSQYVDVELVLPSPPETLSLRMAAWTPGSYRIRDYAKFVERFRASNTDGTPLAVSKSSKDTWAITGPFSGPVVVRYSVDSHELNVRGNWVEPDFASLNGAPTFVVPVGHERETLDVRIQSPESWPVITTALPPHPSGEAGRYRAPNYDVLVDSPILLGTQTPTQWTVTDPADPSRQVPHLLVHEGLPESWDLDQTASDVQRITAEIIGFWRGIPYENYAYINLITGGRGGLEHKASTLMIASPYITKDEARHKDWLGLVSHEFFHTWNVKRLRPVGLGPFDLSKETYTPSLWVAEGITSYYDDLLLRRAGLLSDDEYLRRMAENVTHIQARPGRFERSLEDSSHDAWIKYYQRDHNESNTSISYYKKGAVVGWLLDAEIRRASNGSASLDDAMRLAYARYAAGPGYTAAEFQAVCEEVAGTSLEDFFATAIRGTDELNYEPALKWFGLEWESSVADDPSAWLGLRMNGDRIFSIVRGSPAWKADLLPGDEIIAAGGYRVRGGLNRVLSGIEPGDSLTLTIARHDKLRTVSVEAGEEPLNSWSLQVDEGASVAARTHRKAWFTPAVPVPEPSESESVE